MLGIVQMARITDKAKAAVAGTLGEYDYACGMDKGVFEFLELDPTGYLEVVGRATSDDEIEAYLQDFIARKTVADIEAFNERFINYRPREGSDAMARFIETRDQVAPGREDIRTPSDLLDFEEGRAALIGTAP